MRITLNRRQFLMGALCAASAFAITSCGGSEEQSPEEREYIADSDIDALFTNPDDFRGKWVKLPGKTLQASEKKGDVTGLQAWYDTSYSRSYIVHFESDESFGSGEYILVDGKVDGKFTGQNAFGADITVPLIVDATVTKSNYIDAVAPAKATSEPAVSVEQNGITFACDKVEYADIETRVTLTVTNNSSAEVSFGKYQIRLVQDGHQINQDQASQSAYEGNYPELGYDVTPGASTSGTLVFPAMEEGSSFQVVIPDIYSDDYTTEFTDVTLDIPAA